MRMRIGGLQKVTLLDYPGKVACTVFLPGCNLRCPFCHNPALVLPDRATGGLSTEKLLAFWRPAEESWTACASPAGSRPCTRIFRRCCGRSGRWALP